MRSRTLGLEPGSFSDAPRTCAPYPRHCAQSWLRLPPSQLVANYDDVIESICAEGRALRAMQSDPNPSLPSWHRTVAASDAIAEGRWFPPLLQQAQGMLGHSLEMERERAALRAEQTDVLSRWERAPAVPRVACLARRGDRDSTAQPSDLEEGSSPAPRELRSE